ncbi:MAG: AbrB/MazE/SpoVT family DNA-binding domain-containing protein [Anaerolineales bacterium]|jgi:AbrB family looped-hinge helix DNA binding protein|nr:AbrB/MazE/SpoVT family DNA-binding domain-containing protein [Anaerolineales bacterium]
MSEDRPYYKTRLRARGQITVPPEIRKRLGVRDGDDILFYVTEKGQIAVAPAQIIDPEQAWFWTERWQKMERESDEDVKAGRVYAFDNVEDAIAFLDSNADAEDNNAKD